MPTLTMGDRPVINTQPTVTQFILLIDDIIEEAIKDSMGVFFACGVTDAIVTPLVDSPSATVSPIVVTFRSVGDIIACCIVDQV